jgi:hypothetical protein
MTVDDQAGVGLVCVQEPFDRLLERPQLRAVEILPCVQGGEAGALEQAVRSRRPISSASARRRTISRLGRERPVSRNETCRVVVSATSARSSWLTPRSRRQERSNAPNGLSDRIGRTMAISHETPMLALRIPFPDRELRRPCRFRTLLGMRITRQAIVNASAEDVWGVVAHEFDLIGSWATAVPASNEAAHAAAPAGCPVGGRTCQTTMGMFPEVEERIVSYDQDGRTLTYEPVRGIPRFTARARTTWQVVAIDDRRSQVRFTATVTTRGIARPLMALAMRVQMGRAGVHVFDDLRHYVEHGKPSPRKQRQLDRASVTSRHAARSARAA